MAIIGTLPVTLTNGTLADATQVMSDFNFIVAQVNANSASLAGGNAFTGAQTIAGDTITTNNASQTLTNKTLTGPIVNGLVVTGQISAAAGSAGAPTYSITGSLGTGLYSPGANTWAISNNGAETIRGDASGSVGIGVTPSAWGSSSVLQVGAYSSIQYGISTGYTSLSSNLYYDGANWKYKASDFASQVSLGAGTIIFKIAPLGTAGNNATLNVSLSIDTAGRLSGSALHNNASLPSGTTNQYIASGTYTPTFTAVANVTGTPAVSTGNWKWTRVGNCVTIAGNVSIQATTQNNSTSVGISLPIASNIATTGDLSGTAASTSTSQVTGALVNGDATNDRATLSFIAATGTSGLSTTWTVIAMYEVLT
jgi:hypothetical protein